MAQILLPGHLAAVQGSVGGTTFRVTRGGHGVTAKPSTRRGRRNSQRPSTARLAQLMTAWRDTLTGAQRSTWANYATQSGFTLPGRPKAALAPTNAYLQFNLPRLLVDLSRIDVPPPFFSRLAPPTSATSLLAATFIKLDDSGQFPGLGEFFIVSLSNPVSPAANNPRYWFRQHWLLTGPITVDQFLSIDHPRQVGATFKIHIRILRDDALISLPQIVTDVL